jgi:hypothetical protein
MKVNTVKNEDVKVEAVRLSVKLEVELGVVKALKSELIYLERKVDPHLLIELDYILESIIDHVACGKGKDIMMVPHQIKRARKYPMLFKNPRLVSKLRKFKVK